MKTRCKVCLSAQKEYIEEMLTEGLPLIVISGRLEDVYEEIISTESLRRHRDNHMTNTRSESQRVEEVTGTDKNTVTLKTLTDPTVLPDEEVEADAPLSEMGALEARINALELILADVANPAQFLGFKSYNIAGEMNNSISYKDLVTELIPDKKDLHGQYMAIGEHIKARRVKEGGLILTDESFIAPRAKLHKKSKAVAQRGLNKAMAELAKREKEKDNFRRALDVLATQERQYARGG
jgi:hypothetical protein